MARAIFNRNECQLLRSHGMPNPFFALFLSTQIRSGVCFENTVYTWNINSQHSTHIFVFPFKWKIIVFAGYTICNISVSIFNTRNAFSNPKINHRRRVTQSIVQDAFRVRHRILCHWMRSTPNDGIFSRSHQLRYKRGVGCLRLISWNRFCSMPIDLTDIFEVEPTKPRRKLRFLCNGNLFSIKLDEMPSIVVPFENKMERKKTLRKSVVITAAWLMCAAYARERMKRVHYIWVWMLVGSGAASNSIVKWILTKKNKIK